jgi:hypothetical protein
MFNNDSGPEFVSEFAIRRARVWPYAQRKSTGIAFPRIREIVRDSRQVKWMIEGNNKAAPFVGSPKQSTEELPERQ